MYSRVREAEDIPRPWLKFADGLPAEIEVPNLTMTENLEAFASTRPKDVAVDYLGTRFTYSGFMRLIDTCARAFMAIGVGEGDSVTVSLPNIPNALIIFYALNRIGARACMTHPLSSPAELRHYIVSTESRIAVTADLFYDRFRDVLDDGTLKKLVIAHIHDYLPSFKKAAFKVTKGRKISKLPERSELIEWKPFIAGGKGTRSFPKVDPKSGSVVLFSGGTTQLPKGILLSSYNFNALAIGTKGVIKPERGDSILAILPVFHGFGLGLCIHTCLTIGVKAVLIPEFSTKNYISALIKHKPSFMAGVPTLFEALMRDERFGKVDFSNLKGAYSGGDSLYSGIKKRFDAMIQAQGSKTELKEGYGLTETVTACMISPDTYRENSMGIPLPNIVAKVVEPGTTREIPYGEEGEICVFGPTLMLGYVGDEAATNEAIKQHEDGCTWLHTGDMGVMDEDGYFYFKNRIKRILKVSGMSVYPMQVEQVLESHPFVFKACVIGLPDDYQMTSVKAFIILDKSETGSRDEDTIRKEILSYCHKHLIKWSVPRAIEFREDLPKTLVGKVAYTVLEKEELEKLK